MPRTHAPTLTHAPSPAPGSSRSRRLLLALSMGVAALAASLPGGCASGTGGSSTRAGAQQTVPESPYSTLGYRLEWRNLPVIARRARPQFFDVMGDVATFHDTQNTVTVMTTDTGRTLWGAEIDNPINRFMGNVRRDNELLSSSDTDLLVLDIRTGELKDRHGLAVVVNTKPVLTGNMLVYGSRTGEVLGHNLSSTYKQWGYRLSGPIDAQPVLVSDNVAVVSQGGEVVVLDPATGESIGRNRVYNGLRNRPAASDDTVFVASLDQSVYALEARGERVRWRHRTQAPILAQPVYHDGVLYLEIPERGLTAFDAGTGAIRWENGEVTGKAIGMRDGRLLVWNGATVFALDPQRGDILDRVDLPGLFDLVTSEFIDGDLYAVASDGWVSKYAPKR